MFLCNNKNLALKEAQRLPPTGTVKKNESKLGTELKKKVYYLLLKINTGLFFVEKRTMVPT